MKTYNRIFKYTYNFIQDYSRFINSNPSLFVMLGSAPWSSNMFTNDDFLWPMAIVKAGLKINGDNMRSLYLSKPVKFII